MAGGSPPSYGWARACRRDCSVGRLHPLIFGIDDLRVDVAALLAISFDLLVDLFALLLQSGELLACFGALLCGISKLAALIT